MAAAVLLAYVPRLPSSHAPAGLGLASGSVRITPGTNRRLRVFATTQIAFSFVLLAGAGMLLATLVALQTANTGYDMRQVLAFDVPTPALGPRRRDRRSPSIEEATRRIGELPGVEGVAVGSFVPWRDAGSCGPAFQFAVEGYTPADGEENPHARLRIVAPGFFAVLGVPLLAGRDFTDDDRRGSEPVVDRQPERRAAAVPERRRAQPEAVVDRSGTSASRSPRRIVGVVADVDDENVVPGPALTIYHPLRQMGVAGRLFVHAAGDPYALVPPVTRDHPRDLRGPAGRARRDARGRARGSAGAGAAERVRVLRIRRHRAADRGRRRRRRAGVLGERAHARVRRAAGRRLDAAAPAGAACCRRAR